MDDLVSEREAAEEFERIGVDRETARRVLRTGLAGTGRRTRAATLYDRRRVRDLVDRVAGPDGHVPMARTETFVARTVPRTGDRGIDLSLPVPDQLDLVRRGWQLGPAVGMLVHARVERDGSMPFLATVSGFVVLGADIIGFDPAGGTTPSGRPGCAFRLRPAGEWFDGLLGRMLDSGVGGGSHRIDGPPGSAFVSVPGRRRIRFGT